MNILRKILHAMLTQDLKFFSNPNLTWIIYLSVFIIIFLENGILPTAFLPGDSLLILLGVMTSKKILNFYIIVTILTISAGFGSWISYIQGKWLSKNRIIKNWILSLPKKYYEKANRLFNNYGLSALIIGRFISFIRTLLPLIAGFSGLKSSRFHFFNWISSFLWVFILIIVGMTFGKTKIFKHYEKICMLGLFSMPLILLTIGLISSITFLLRKKKNNKS